MRTADVVEPPRLIAWATGRNYGQWHLDLGQEWRPLCGAVIPDQARRCDSRSWDAIRKLDMICHSCLQAYSGSEAE